MTDAARYAKVVEWSEEDGAFVGQCPGIVGPCCHGPDEVEVYRELCEIVEEWVELALKGWKAAPLADGRDRRRREDRLGRPVLSSAMVRGVSAEPRPMPWDKSILFDATPAGRHAVGRNSRRFERRHGSCRIQ